jgi:hypothetical protein
MKNNMILFLDIDGVLNGHRAHENGYCGTYPSCVAVFNDILEHFPEIPIVVSSAWRYLVLNKCMTIKGFENMMLTHGLKCRGRFEGITVSDEVFSTREYQILDYVGDSKSEWLAIDDLPLALPDTNFYRTNGETGLTEEDGSKIKNILLGLTRKYS